MKEPVLRPGVAKGVKRPAVVALLVATVLLASVETSLAKLPPWTCEFSTTRPVVGHRVDVVVRFWRIPPPGGPIHARPDRSWRIPSIPLLVGRPDGPGPVSRTLTGSIHLVRPGVYRARFVFPDTSTFRFDACATTYDELGYPAGDRLLVRPRAFITADPGRAGSPPDAPEVGGALVVGLGATVLVARLCDAALPPLLAERSCPTLASPSSG